MERLYNIQLSPEGKVIRIVVEQLLRLPLKFHLSKLSRNEKQNLVPKQWISKDVPRYGSQSERAKIAIHWFGELNETIKNANERFYYINTNEITNELSRENLISSHVKITSYLHMWKYHHCYGFIINRTFQTKKLFISKMVWHFIGVYMINRTLHGRLEIRNFSSRVEKNISPVRCAHSWNIFQHRYLRAAM